MEIRCKIYGEYFCPGDDTMDLTEGYISSDSVNTCDDCWDLIELSEYDLIESFSDADLGLKNLTLKSKIMEIFLSICLILWFIYLFISSINDHGSGHDTPRTM